ncbi:N-acetylglucosamine kinase [Jinshanibacter sp. LJY008]|uniref:N-acetyl-D-glucosamine kinase n=1 Tax=Limnobaculum eriocheiris TaxID=2897391 RepID=A0A9X1MYX1_9GAMM|nr:N-acetylglucosamine kinase [Limnobaculum eriocheiris]MCD1127352.1 N-acetylglucosamine kinase [Limnobaculum eriocheiris]
MYYGFDMGGTKIEFGAFDEQHHRLIQKRVPTPRDDYPTLLKVLAELVIEADSQLGCQGKVGIGIPGMPDGETGKLFTANVPAAMGKPLAADLAALIQRPVRIDNDANCFALSEAWDGEFRQYASVLGIILGTGVGGGIVINGKTFSGRHYIAGEFGHLRLPVDALEVLGRDIPRVACGCGHAGCIENYISGRGFEWVYQHFFDEKLPAQQIIQHYRAGEAKAVEHVERFLNLLAICLANIFTVLDPHLVVLGGGLSNFDEMYPLLPERIKPHLLSVAKVPRIEKARWGDSGGVRGAAFLNLLD